jgi:hypothetical protein
VSLIPTDMLDTVTLITNIAVFVSIIFLAYQIYLQRKETEYNRYEKLMSDFSETATTLVDNPEVRDIVIAGNGRPKNWGKYTEPQKKAYFYFDSLISLLERVYVGVPHSKPSDDWAGWKIWVEDLSTNDLFVDAFNDNKRMYSALFVVEIESVIRKRVVDQKK